MMRFLKQLFCVHVWVEGWPAGEEEPADAKTCYCVLCDKRGIVYYDELRAGSGFSGVASSRLRSERQQAAHPSPDQFPKLVIKAKASRASAKTFRHKP